MKKRLFFGMTALVLLAGCVAVAPYQRSMIDTRGVDPNQYNADVAQCQQASMQVDRGASTAGSAAVGSVIGALLGAAVGYRGDAVAAGAVAGALVGGAAGDVNSAQAQQNIFNNCMAGRGYRFISPAPYQVQY